MKLPEKVYFIVDKDGKIISKKYWTKKSAITSHLEYALRQQWQETWDSLYKDCYVQVYSISYCPIEFYPVDEHKKKKEENIANKKETEKREKIRRLKAEIAKLN